MFVRESSAKSDAAATRLPNNLHRGRSGRCADESLIRVVSGLLSRVFMVLWLFRIRGIVEQDGQLDVAVSGLGKPGFVGSPGSSIRGRVVWRRQTSELRNWSRLSA
jgi:hypothetical protein